MEKKKVICYFENHKNSAELFLNNINTTGANVYKIIKYEDLSKYGQNIKHSPTKIGGVNNGDTIFIIKNPIQIANITVGKGSVSNSASVMAKIMAELPGVRDTKILITRESFKCMIQPIKKIPLGILTMSVSLFKHPSVVQCTFQYTDKITNNLLVIITGAKNRTDDLCDPEIQSKVIKMSLSGTYKVLSCFDQLNIYQIEYIKNIILGV